MLMDFFKIVLSFAVVNFAVPAVAAAGKSEDVILFANIALEACPVAVPPKPCAEAKYLLPLSNIAITLKPTPTDPKIFAGSEMLDLAKEGISFSSRIDVTKRPKGAAYEYVIKATLTDSSGAPSYPSLESETRDLAQLSTVTLKGLAVLRHEVQLTPFLVIGQASPMLDKPKDTEQSRK